MTQQFERVRQYSLQQFRKQEKAQINQPLISNDKQEPVNQPLRYIKYQNQKVLAGPQQKLKPLKNTICNTKYTIFTFVPKVLYDQFKYFFNLFFLVIAISQFIPVLSVGLLFSYLAPLVLILALTMLKQGYQDYKRFKKDEQVNNALYNVFTPEGIIKVQSKNLKVGDIIELCINQRVPADLILIHTTDQTGSIFVKTDQLDGETDWKLRKPINNLNFLLNKNKSQIFKTNFNIEYKQPTANIYKFQAKYTNQNIAEGLNLQQTAWGGVKLACGKALGVVVFIGKDMKMSLNIKQPDTKFGRLDWQLNFLSKLLFVMMVLLSLLLLIFKGFDSSFGDQSILFFRYLLLLSSIIPISMRVNLDFAKLVYSRNINIDTNIPETTVRNSNIPEELGRIQYILSDKTGTLTKNQMIFKKLIIDESNQIEAEEIHLLKQIVKKQCELNEGPLSDYKSDKKHPKRSTDSVWRDLVSALILCHNVTPAVQNQERVLQGSSPDQVALVKLAEVIGFKLQKRSQIDMKIINSFGVEENYEILAIFPFSSQRKRMGIIIKHKQSNRYIFYLKGADSIMKTKIIQSKANFMIEACNDLASEGLRTLVICQKWISQAQYIKWKTQYEQAKTSIHNRQARQNQVIDNLEKGMEFLGITGVEDKLQDNIRQTISSLRGAGINFWMLTGDKIQTAICIAVSTHIKQKQQEIFIIQENDNKEKFQQSLKKLYQALNVSYHELKKNAEITFKNILIIIDGTSLKLALSEQFVQQFMNIASRVPSLVCSRCSPTQKAEITEKLRFFTKKVILGIGDGGNDVGMIQSADVGIGIYGKQGIQAALASDFSITQFKNLNTLLLWHGRLSYKRSCVLGQFIMHRGIIISIMQAIFTTVFYFVAIPIFNGVLMLGYSTLFTVLPVFSLIFDEDISREMTFQYPLLYKKVQSGSQLNMYTFIYWIFISVYQGSVIMILELVFFKNNSFYLITTISFTCLIFIQFLNVFTSIHQLHVIHIVTNILSGIVYVLTMAYMRNVLNATDMIEGNALLLTIAIVAIAWLPPFIYKMLKKFFDPTDEERIMKIAKKQLIAFRIQ